MAASPAPVVVAVVVFDFVLSSFLFTMSFTFHTIVYRIFFVVFDSEGQGEKNELRIVPGMYLLYKKFFRFLGIIQRVRFVRM